MEDLTKKHVLGRVVASIKVIEFQKRGLPHAHILLILSPNSKPMGPRDYDTIVQAEIPDPVRHPAAYETVTKFMMHGPCGPAHPSAPCMENGRCNKKYPKAFREETTIADEGGYPLYKRPSNGRTYQRSPNAPALDNRWVVPHNVYLCTKYNAHLNVEICTGIRAVKYLYKYVYKGHDKTLMAMRREYSATSVTNEPINEIAMYQDARYVSASEAIWRLFDFHMHARSPAVQQLALHLPGNQAVYFRPDETVKQVVERASLKLTTLEAFFVLNRSVHFRQCPRMRLTLLCPFFPFF